MNPSAKFAISVIFILASAVVGVALVWLSGVTLISGSPSRTILLPPPIPSPVRTFLTGMSTFHNLGHIDGRGWATDANDPNWGFLNFGPYTQSLAAGPYQATFRLMIGDVTSRNRDVVGLDIREAGSGQKLAEMRVPRSQFKQAMVYQDFDLPFNAPPHNLEFRTYTWGSCYINQEKVTITPLASAPPIPEAYVFPTALSNYHNAGHPDGVGFTAGPQDTKNQFLNYGPYTEMLPAGHHVATFRLWVHKVTAADTVAVNLDVNDVAGGRVLGRLTLNVNQFKQAGVYQDFDLPFDSPAHSNLEFRTFVPGNCYVNQQSVTVTGQLAPNGVKHP